VPDHNRNIGEHENRNGEQQMSQHITKPTPGREFLMANKHHPTNRNCMVHSSRFGSVSGPTALTMEAQKWTIACLLVDGIRQRLSPHLSLAKLDGSSQEFRTLSGPAQQKGINHAPSAEISVSLILLQQRGQTATRPRLATAAVAREAEIQSMQRAAFKEGRRYEISTRGT
jgi:hypothetical protein